MTSTRTELPSPTRRSRWSWVVAPFRRIGRWFRHQPRGLQIGLVAVVVAGIGVGIYFGQSYLSQRDRAHAVAAAWGEYGNAVRKIDYPAIQTALDRVLTVSPGDPAATRYQAILASGSADPDTPELASVLLYEHIRNNRLKEASREGEKVLARNPKDWQSRCAIAHHALQVLGDRNLAEQHLAQLPDPEDPMANVNAGGLLYALRLSSAVGRDAVALRRVIVRRLVPMLRSRTAADAPATAKAQLLDCYLEAFGDSGSIGGLFEFWADADRLADGAVGQAAAAGDVALLSRLAQQGTRMRLALVVLRDHDPARLPDDRLRAFMKAVDDRTRRAWLAVRDKAPDQSEAYRGLAELAFLANDPAGALQFILDGLAACGDRVELMELRARLITAFGSQQELKAFGESTWKAAMEAKDDPIKWCLAANAQITLRRMDYALAACARALAIRRDHPIACQTAAWILVRSGSPIEFTQAREVLGRLGEEAPRTSATLAWLQARVLIGTGLTVLLDDEFQKVLEAQAKLRPKTVAPALGMLLGVLDAEPDLARTEWVARKAGQLLADDPDLAAARRLRAAALFRLADLTVTTNPGAGPPVWVGDRVTAALQAFESMPSEERTEASVAAAIAMLQLKAQGNAAAALRTAGALRAVEGSLNSGQLEVLGAVLTASGKAADAVRVLERAVEMPQPSAGLRITLAEAYMKNNQPNEARAELGRAEESPNRSPREQAELIAAKKRLLSENK